MATSEERVLMYRGVPMTYYVIGEGRPLILMHGWGCSSQTVNSIALTASESGWKVYNVDFPGFGKSGEPTEIWGVDEYTRLIEQLVEDEGLKAPALIGHSFGGRVSILFSSRNDTDRVILVDAAGIKPSRPLSYYLKVYSFKTLKRIMKIFRSKKEYEKWLENYRKKKGSADYAASSPMMRSILSKVVNEDLKKELPKIKAPVLLIWGCKDTATPIKDAKLMEKLIPDAGLVEFSDAGHYSFLDEPQRFKAVLRHFLTHNPQKSEIKTVE